MSTIPTTRQCHDLLKRADVPEHIQAHSLLVARIAELLAFHLNGNGHSMDLSLVRAGALLHDIAKKRSLTTGENHAVLGALLLERWGWPVVAPIVRDHVVMTPRLARGPITESLVVNYADKRVRHETIVELDERFEDLIRRYARSPAHEQELRNRLELYRIVEKRIFEHLSFVPEALSDLLLTRHETNSESTTVSSFKSSMDDSSSGTSTLENR